MFIGPEGADTINNIIVLGFYIQAIKGANVNPKINLQSLWKILNTVCLYLLLLWVEFFDGHIEQTV